jgi:hypothetical protein
MVVMVRNIRGTIRARCIDTIKDMSSIVTYNTKNPAVGLLDAATVSAIQAVTIRLTAQLLAKRPR